MSSHKHLLIALGIGIAAFMVWEMIKAVKAGVSAVGDILMAPFTAISAAWNGVTGAASSITGTVANIQAGNQAEAQLNTLNNSDYAPGGSIYNEIAAQQGQAAADAAWQTVQNNQAQSASTDVTANPLSWINLI